MPIKLVAPNKIFSKLRRETRKFITNKFPYLKEKILKLRFDRLNPQRREYDPNKLFDHICVETVSYCNNNCPFCAASTLYNHKSKTSFMSQQLYIKILNELKEIDYKGSFGFWCNNEPLVDERIFDFIRKARYVLPNTHFGMYTNGILLNKEKAERLFKSGLNRLAVDNYHDDFKLLKGVRDVYENLDPSLGDVEIRLGLKNDFKSYRAHETLGTNFSLPRPFHLICERPNYEIIVVYDGTVPLCCADATWKQEMGNVNEQGLTEIWFSPEYRRIRRALLKGDRSCNHLCAQCDSLV